MKRIKTETIAEFSGGQLTGPGGIYAQGVETDSRKAGEGSLFIGLKGEKADGNAYAQGAYDRGCRIFMLSSKEAAEGLTSAYPDAAVILVEDTLKGMQLLAKNMIEEADIYRIAITGSTGKTSTKEILRCIMESRYSLICTRGNYNNHIGVPLTAFQMENDTEMGIFEMGMNHKGEIETLADIVRPETAIITNVGSSHIGNLGSRENILAAKLEITSFMDSEKYLLVYNADNDMLQELNGEDTDYEKIRVGEKGGKKGFTLSDIQDLSLGGVDFTISPYKGDPVRCHLPVPGTHNVWNAGLAMVCALHYGISLRESAAALKNLKLTGSRLDVKESPAGIRVINDAYNASPDSVKAGLDFLAGLEAQRRVAVLGDMLELGDATEESHELTGRYAASKGIDLLITVGPHSRRTGTAAAEILGSGRVVSFENASEFNEAALGLLKKGDTVLVKGSHSMGLEKSAEFILNMGV